MLTNIRHIGLQTFSPKIQITTTDTEGQAQQGSIRRENERKMNSKGENGPGL
jgi:hypothetical protein